MRGKTHEEIVNFQAQSFYVVFVHMNILHPILRDITLHEEKKLLKKSKCSIHGKSIFQQSMLRKTLLNSHCWFFMPIDYVRLKSNK